MSACHGMEADRRQTESETFHSFHAVPCLQTSRPNPQKSLIDKERSDACSLLAQAISHAAHRKVLSNVL